MTTVPSIASLFVTLRSPQSLPAGPPTIQTIISGLDVPWSVAFAPDGRIFVTERNGLLLVIKNGALRAQPFADLRSTVVTDGEGGLLEMVLDPGFAQNRLLYVYHTYRDPQGRARNQIVRFREASGGLSESTVLLDGIPAASIHDGGRLKFGPDGKLYATTGDATQSQFSQDVGSLAGKILRINADGSVPADNPFPGSPVWAYGHRNVQRLTGNRGPGRCTRPSTARPASMRCTESSPATTTAGRR